jgi:hypothetical protein
MNKGLQTIRHESVHTYDMIFYLGKKKTCVIVDMTAAQVTVRHLTRWRDKEVTPFTAQQRGQPTAAGQ